MITEPSITHEIINDWQTPTQRHIERLGALVQSWQEKRSRGERQPVLDFLFEYYSFRPSHLLKWNPGFGCFVESSWTPADKHYHLGPNGWWLQPKDFPTKRLDSLDWLIALQTGILARPPVFHCYGLHEWAMVYRADEVRHEQIPLRLPHDSIAQFVESQQVRCSHYDAFRFFTDAARPLNRLQPESSTRTELEQGGCIHANMDLYKWVYKFYPWLPSSLLSDTFMLACETRTMDMMASPYDLSAHGLPPIPIETAEGRAEYIRRQKEIAERANLLRIRLLESLQLMRSWIKSEDLSPY